MKLFKYVLGLIVVSLFLSANAFAQEEMTSEEWENEIARLTQKKSDLTQDLQDLQNEVNNLKSTKAGLQSYSDCQDELYALVGATQTDVDNFRNQVNSVSGKINRKESPKDDRAAELAALQSNKISALPEFYNKVHNELQRKLDAWVEAPKEIMYSVVKGDHLWGIAKKKDHYDNPFAWPMIYKANRDQINDPDLIYPKQTFKIPNLTDDEVAKYNKIRKNYKPAPVE
ncbi:MAG: LysM peptidoglycan-binding domain-containing protein [Ignavibacteriae bacterium]|jgi:nucleoid-associated protein YgaU|nr:LysM peptidoglycan-binding domain-containing protein [Ignavibacteriota bacterium]NOG96711.1 LysM peptidoglycan-binding domain-containing protein [Ignavibacteriota bacterium]